MRKLAEAVWHRAIGLERRSALRCGVTVLAVALLTALLSPLRLRLGLVSIGLLFLLLVVLVAARWGWGPGLLASVVANLAFNFFFVPPLHTFTVQEPAKGRGLVVFLFVASVTCALLARARAGETAARRRQQEAAILYDLLRLIIPDVDLSSTLTTIADRVRETFAATSCSVLLSGPDGLMPATSGDSADSGLDTSDERHAAEQALATGTTVVLGGRPGRRSPRIVGLTGRPAPVVYVPLRVGGRTNGVLRVVGRLEARVFTDDELRLLEAFADQAAPAVERDRLLREAARVQALQEADQLKSALLAAVSHDLRTPLTTILASASSLLQPEVQWDEATRRQFLTQIEEQALRLTRLVSNLLDLSRIEGGAIRPDQDWYDVREMLDGAIAALGPVDGRHPVVLDVAPGTGAALFDHVQMEQVIHNLLENAAKFSPDGSEIRIAARRADGQVEIGVEDHGPGIAPEERERVFEKFYRVARSTRRVRGAGLGLAICKGLVEANGGRIRSESAPDGGARFVVILPASERSVPGRGMAAPASGPSFPDGRR